MFLKRPEDNSHHWETRSPSSTNSMRDFEVGRSHIPAEGTLEVSSGQKNAGRQPRSLPFARVIPSSSGMQARLSCLLGCSGCVGLFGFTGSSNETNQMNQRRVPHVSPQRHYGGWRRSYHPAYRHQEAAHTIRFNPVGRAGLLRMQAAVETAARKDFQTL